MIVYELRHDIYIWEDCETIVKTLLFETKADAIEYLNIKKADIIDEYCNHLDVSYSIESLRNYINASDHTYDDIIDDEDYFSIEIEEYGHDKLSVNKKEVLKFK
jgi:hypothetical protein